MNKLVYITIFVIFFLLLISVTTVFAVKEGEGGSSGGTVTLTNPLPGGSDINLLIGQVINGVMGVVGSLALVMFVYGGFTWMTAAGSNEKVTKGKDILVWATIGLIVIFSSYAFVRLVLVDILGGKAGS